MDTSESIPNDQFLGFIFEKSQDSSILAVYAALGLGHTEFMGMLDAESSDFNQRLLEMAEAKGWVIA